MYRIFILVVVASFLLFQSYAQSIDVGLFVGATSYNGELQAKAIDIKHSRLAVGATLTYNIDDRFAVRGNVMKTHVSGADAWNEKENMKLRNLSFDTRLYEINVLGKFRILRPENARLSPFIAAGAAVFRVNPFAHDFNGTKVYLYPLSTEGQGLPGYPNRKPHKLYHFAIPFGGGLEYQINDRFSIEGEVMMRKTFTDYIDDVSTTYINPIALLNEKGAKAVEMAYRGMEVGGSSVQPPEGAMRGNPDAKDLYYTGVIRLNFRLFGSESNTFSSGSNGGRNKKFRHRTDCPTW